jgi:hypothetical protein
VDADVGTLATALFVRMDELLKAALPGAVAAAGGDRVQGVRRRTGHPGGQPSPARRHLRGWLACHGDCTKRLRRVAGLIGHAIGAIATDTALGSGDGWIVDATPVEGGRSNQTLKGSALAGWACSGRGASPARRFWGCGCTWSAPGTARPVAVAPAGAKAADREAPLDLPAVQPHLVAVRPGEAAGGRPARPRPRGRGRPGRAGRAAAATDAHGRTQRPGVPLFKPPRQPIESVNHTLKGSSTWSATAVTRPVACGVGSCRAPWPDRRDLAPPPDRPGDPAATGRR